MVLDIFVDPIGNLTEISKCIKEISLEVLEIYWEAFVDLTDMPRFQYHFKKDIEYLTEEYNRICYPNYNYDYNKDNIEEWELI